MALQDNFDTLQSTVTDFISDVGTKLDAVADQVETLNDQQAAMKVSLDAAAAQGTADAATIAELQAQNAAQAASVETVTTGLAALTDAVAAADVAVQPAPPTP